MNSLATKKEISLKKNLNPSYALVNGVFEKAFLVCTADLEQSI